MDSNHNNDNHTNDNDSEQLEQQQDSKQQQQEDKVNINLHFIIYRSYHYYKELPMLVIHFLTGQLFLIVILVSKS